MDVLIVKNDIKYCNKLIKTSKNDLNVKIYIVSQYYEEIEMLIKKINFSMIIIDNELINLYKNIIKDYKKIIFILYVNNVKKIDNTKYYYIDKNFVNDEIFFATIEKLKYINTDYNLRIKIKEELKYLGYNPKYKGTQYIYEAILILLNENLYDYSDNLEKNIIQIEFIREEIEETLASYDQISIEKMERLCRLITHYGNHHQAMLERKESERLINRRYIRSSASTFSKTWDD